MSSKKIQTLVFTGIATIYYFTVILQYEKLCYPRKFNKTLLSLYGMGPTHELMIKGTGIIPGLKVWALESRTLTRI